MQIGKNNNLAFGMLSVRVDAAKCGEQTAKEIEKYIYNQKDLNPKNITTRGLSNQRHVYNVDASNEEGIQRTLTEKLGATTGIWIKRITDTAQKQIEFFNDMHWLTTGKDENIIQH